VSAPTDVGRWLSASRALGVPDTTPEFVSEALLRAYLADAVARARTPGSGTP